MPTASRSSGIALAATGLLSATVASAHLHAPTSFVTPTKSVDHSRVFGGGAIPGWSALLGGRLRWVPAPIFDMFDMFQIESFDPKTGDYRVYAKIAPRTFRDGRPAATA